MFPETASHQILLPYKGQGLTHPGNANEKLRREAAIFNNSFIMIYRCLVLDFGFAERLSIEA